jgi:hypothetical protein
MTGAVIFGGYGTFGAHVTRELARRGVPLVIAGRNLERARALSALLGPPHGARSADVTRFDSCRAALGAQTVAVNCAGPFSAMGNALLEACLAEGCNYVDIADDRSHTALVRSYQSAFEQRNLTAVFGCSSLPGISGALALAALEGGTATPEKARITLFIGNDNAKGAGAIQSLVQVLGRPVQAPQGILKGFGDPERITLPAPFGKCRAYTFDSPEYDLFPGLLGVHSVSAKVSFEQSLVNKAMAFLSALPFSYGRRTAVFLERLTCVLPRTGTSAGVVLVELFFTDGSTRRTAAVARRDGQRMASLPCVLAAEAIFRRHKILPGARSAYDFLGHSCLLDQLATAGFEIHRA